MTVSRKSLAVLTSLSLAVTVLIVIACESTARREERLAKMYCSSCHAFPDPSLLDKKTWERSVLPQMAFRMGLDPSQLYKTVPPRDQLKVLSTIPTQPLVSREQWKAIENYFLSYAPDSLPTIAPGKVIKDSLMGFNVLKPPVLKGEMIVHLSYDSTAGRIQVGTRGSWLYFLDKDFNITRQLRVKSPPSHVIVKSEHHLISLMGIMDPNDQAAGEIIAVNEAYHMRTVIDSLQRPVYMEENDYNGDGEPDFVISAFGNFTGGLYLFTRDGEGSFKRTMISSLPGARKTITIDLNNDGLKDIVALMTQGDEKIVAFVNKGNLKFEGELLLRFPPVYGSSYFDLADFNNDGYVDILYTNGDNADYSMTLKPYHAVRIFENDGNNKFKETWSFPMHGASKAKACDFDEDGDLDIAAIAFFPDFVHDPESGFLYFENKGSNQFIAHTTPAGALGRWLTMETADYDSDGDIDILLGATNFSGVGANPDIYNHWMREGSSLLVLQNNIRHNNAKTGINKRAPSL